MMLKTDLELASYFTEAVGKPYAEGVEFINALPGHALLRFRVAAEALCHRLQHRHGVVAEQPTLCDAINLLHDAGAISDLVKGLLHRVRMAGNQTAHFSRTPREAGEADEPPTQRAQKARDDLLAVLNEVHAKEEGLAVQLSLQKVVNDSQAWKSLVFMALTERSARLKFKAGLWCEGEAERVSRAAPSLIVSDAFSSHVKMLYRQAASFYLAAYQLEPSNLEAGYRYARLVDLELLDGDKKQDAEVLIKNAADARIPEACDLYGTILFETHENYLDAEIYLQRAIYQGEAHAHYVLGEMYLKGSPSGPPDNKKALEHLEAGVAEEEPNSLIEMGRILNDGKITKRDRERARRLVTQAAAQGNGRAKLFLDMEFRGGTKRLAERAKNFSHALKRSLRPPGPHVVPPHQKTGANEPCHCGSGLKYKKCHRVSDRDSYLVGR